MNQSKNKYIWYIVLHSIVLLLSIGGVCVKFASKQPFMSPGFILLYLGEIAILFIYTLIWQQIIKHLPLTVAFSNKAVGSIWTMIWGVVLFGETVTWNMILGAFIIISGVIMVVKSDE